jgi:hypothetical protein
MDIGQIAHVLDLHAIFVIAGIPLSNFLVELTPSTMSAHFFLFSGIISFLKLIQLNLRSLWLDQSLRIGPALLSPHRVGYGLMNYTFWDHLINAGFVGPADWPGSPPPTAATYARRTTRVQWEGRGLYFRSDYTRVALTLRMGLFKGLYCGMRILFNQANLPTG